METEEDIVISGVSGRLPHCNNVQEFWDALYKGEDLVSEDDSRFPAGIIWYKIVTWKHSFENKSFVVTNWPIMS